jgi:hypothetical protein
MAALALTNYLETNWNAVLWALGVFLGASLLLELAQALARRSLRQVWRGALVTFALVVLAIPGWHLFGWETLHTDTGSRIRRHRCFGRVTHVAFDLDGYWKAEAKCIYRWSEPWTSEREYEPYFVVCMEDRNRDGQWDTWWTPTSRDDGTVALTLEADLDLDGKRDFEALEPAD